MKKILLIGGSGFSGAKVLDTLLAKGYHVTAISRKANKIKQVHDQLIVKEGNVLNPIFMQDVINGHDVVINCLGIGGKGDGKPNTLISDSTRVLVAAMEQNNVERIIAMSNVGAGDSRDFQPFIFKKVILPYFMKWLKVIIEDKDRMESIIFGSQLDWTIVRCPNITSKPKKNKVHATLDGEGLKLNITNDDLASFIVGQIDTQTYSKKAPCVSN